MTEVRVDQVESGEDRPAEAGPPGEPRERGVLVRVLPVVALVVLALTLYFRIAGPSNIYDKDQSKTIAYTVDMVRNGRWALPYDMIMQPATKPPLYNWISTAISGPLGLWSEWALKLPAMLAGAAIAGMLVFMGGRLLRCTAALGVSSDEPRVIGIGWLAAILWLASWSASELIYLARPDMLLAAPLTGAWACGTVALERDDVAAAPTCADRLLAVRDRRDPHERAARAAGAGVRRHRVEADLRQMADARRASAGRGGCRCASASC